MITSTQTPSKSGNGALHGSRPTFVPLTLKGLGQLDVEALQQQYDRGSVPASLEVLDGLTRGRLLCLSGRAAHPPFSRIISRVAASALFPWRGKRFQSESGERGRGVNRFRILVGFERGPFRSRIEPSAVDGAPTIRLDYGVAGNPWWLRLVEDEIREVSPGLFMGPALLRLGPWRRILLYFALEVPR